MIRGMFVMLVLLSTVKSYGQDAYIKFNLVDTTINSVQYVQKTWMDERLKDMKYVEWYTKDKSVLVCSYSMLFNKLFGVRNTYNESGFLLETESFMYGLPIGTTKQYYDNGIIRAEGTFKISPKGNYTDTVCIETSPGVGDVNCSAEHYSFPKDGKWIYYSDNGNKQSEGFYTDNKKTGTWVFYDPSNNKIIDKKNW